jgi:type II secretory pathway pseudopilin PulG
VIAIVLMILAIALPVMKSARLNAGEPAVAREVQTIGQVEMQYQSQFGKYAATLSELGPPANGAAAGTSRANLIPAGFASGESQSVRRHGLVVRFTLTPMVWCARIGATASNYSEMTQAATSTLALRSNLPQPTRRPRSA